jgi:alpha-1,2-mannosyltransferase
VKAFTLGQIQLWLDGMFALALLCWATGRKACGGLLIGLMCLIKPQYGLLLLWAVLRREWQFVVGCVGIMAVGLVGSVAVFGWANHVDYLRVLAFLSQHGEAYYPNQSINGLLNRLMSLADPAGYVSLEFRDHVFPTFNIWVYGGTLVTSLVIVSAALLPRGTAGDPDRTIDLGTMALSATIASPIAWEHHYGILFPVFAVLLARWIGSRRRLLWLAASYVLISNFIPATNLLAGTVFNVAQSYVLAAALGLLVMMHGARLGWPVAGNTPIASPAR